MRTNYTVNSGVRFEMLSQDQLQELFDGVLHVLQHTGLDVYHDEARDILAQAGARVDGIRVRIPAYVVKRALSLAPRSFSRLHSPGLDWLDLAGFTGVLMAAGLFIWLYRRPQV